MSDGDFRSIFLYVPDNAQFLSQEDSFMPFDMAQPFMLGMFDAWVVCSLGSQSPV